MKAAKQYVQPVAPGLFDTPRRLAQLQQMGDPLAALNAVMDWTIFVPMLARIPRAEPKAPGGRPAYLPLTLFKILVLQSLYGLSDEQAQFQILDRRSFQHFLKGSVLIVYRLDRKRFVAALGEACTKTDWQTHAYCLMLNHFHLVMETPNANLVAGMRWFLSTYTARFNRRHKLFGHLFSGRYKSLIVDGSGNGYLRPVCDYVHLNPMRANRLRSDQPLKDFAWSSWPEFLKPPEERLAWLRADRLLGELRIPKDSAAAREQLEQYLEQRRTQEDGEEFKAIRRGWCLGDETFRQELLEGVHTRATESHH